MKHPAQVPVPVPVPVPVSPRINLLRSALCAVVWCAAALLVAAPWPHAVAGVVDTSSVGGVGGAGKAADRARVPALQLIDEQRHVADLEVSLGQLRTAATARQKETADLQARLAEALRHRSEAGVIYPLSWVAALLTLTLLLLGGLLWHESRQRHRDRRLSEPLRKPPFAVSNRVRRKRPQLCREPSSDPFSIRAE